MKLSDELSSLGIALSPSEFRDMLADVFAELFPDRTVDDLITQWRDVAAYCAAVERRMGVDSEVFGLTDEMIVRRLLSLRKNRRSLLPASTMARRAYLDVQLKAVGVDVDALAFRKTIERIYKQIYFHWNPEAFLAHWRDAAYFCGLVAGDVGAERSPSFDAVVLRTVLNMRRRGMLSRADRIGTGRLDFKGDGDE